MLAHCTMMQAYRMFILFIGNSKVAQYFQVLLDYNSCLSRVGTKDFSCYLPLSNLHLKVFQEFPQLLHGTFELKEAKK